MSFLGITGQIIGYFDIIFRLLANHSELSFVPTMTYLSITFTVNTRRGTCENEYHKANIKPHMNRLKIIQMSAIPNLLIAGPYCMHNLEQNRVLRVSGKYCLSTKGAATLYDSLVRSLAIALYIGQS